MSNEPTKKPLLQKIDVVRDGYENSYPVGRFCGQWDAWQARATVSKATKGDERAVDEKRYQRLRILGAAPCYSSQLASGTVLRFQSLDAYLDADIASHPTRGEFSGEPARATVPQAEQRMSDAEEPSFVNLEGLRAKLLAPRVIVRDEDGYLTHPDFPICDEGTHAGKFLDAFGIEAKFVAMESDDPAAADRYFEAGEAHCSYWTPTAPEGDGWLLLEIYETEDGPYALYGRDRYEAENAAKRKRTREQHDRIDGARKADSIAEKVGADATAKLSTETVDNPVQSLSNTAHIGGNK